jgi:hypothetical protein
MIKGLRKAIEIINHEYSTHKEEQEFDGYTKGWLTMAITSVIVKLEEKNERQKTSSRNNTGKSKSPTTKRKRLKSNK